MRVVDTQASKRTKERGGTGEGIHSRPKPLPETNVAPDVAETNNLASLRRTPSELRRYLKWTKDVMTEYGSVTQYILVHRLPKSWGQPPFTPASPLPFEDAADYRTLPNDWPYALEPGITHLVVWSRTPIPTDPETGDMTAESRARVAMFVNRYFVDALGSGGADKVVWFKNWVSLQSVPSLEHVHVLVRDVGDDMLELWTGERLRRKD